ncbi:hypothetical protein [Streptosporangium sp. NPDC000396]|uniref:hypothetical protein n=1 Tax=Streptosporangium sp. NPDC000396 TaxID=3366185 RepID=UPI0036B73131
MLASRVEAACEKFQEILASCEGCFIDAVSFGTIGGRDYLDVRLVQTQKWEQVTILLEGVRHFSISEGWDIQGSFVDQISVSYLPKTDRPWPVEAERLVTRFDGLPELYWVQLVGPTMISAVAAIMTVSTSQDLLEG